MYAQNRTITTNGKKKLRNSKNWKEREGIRVSQSAVATPSIGFKEMAQSMYNVCAQVIHTYMYVDV